MQRYPLPDPCLSQAWMLLDSAWRCGENYFPCATDRERNLRGGTRVAAESFTAMIIADVLMNVTAEAPLVRNVLAMLEHELGEQEVFYFFKDHQRLPADADCTAFGLSVLLHGESPSSRRWQTAHRALDRILANLDASGVVATYFDPTLERAGIVDPVVCANVLYFAYQLGRGGEARTTLEFVHRVLVEGLYLEGTRYYHSPDSFLYFLGRMVRRAPETHDLLLAPLKHAIRARLGSTSHTIDVAQRTLLCTWFGLDHLGEARRLLDCREPDGGWATDALFRYGRTQVYFGSRAMATAFAIAATETVTATMRRHGASSGWILSPTRRAGNLTAAPLGMAARGIGEV